MLENIASEKHPQRAVEARGILVQIDLNFVGCLVLFRKVLSDAKYLSDMLQSKTVDYAKAVELIEALKETLLHYNVGLLGHRPLDGANSVFLFSVLFPPNVDC